jgi:hypothetical protein
MPDDSIMLIKGNYHTQSSFCTSSPIVDPLEVETFSISDLPVPPHTEMEATKGHFQSEAAKDAFNNDKSHPTISELAAIGPSIDNIMSAETTPDVSFTPAELVVNKVDRNTGAQQVLTETPKMLEMVPHNELVSHPSPSQQNPTGLNGNLIVAQILVSSQEPSKTMTNHAVDLEAVHLETPSEVDHQLLQEVGSHDTVAAADSTRGEEPLRTTHTQINTNTPVSNPDNLVVGSQEEEVGEASSVQMPNIAAPSHDPTVDDFLESITAPLQQPIIQGGFQTPNIQAQSTNTNRRFHSPPHSATQRKSTRLAKKATLNVGKDTIQIAQDLLIKKLGELSGEETNQDEADSDFDLYAQHFERPIDKSKMEAITVLIEEGNKKQKKSSANKRMTA